MIPRRESAVKKHGMAVMADGNDHGRDLRVLQHAPDIVKVSLKTVLFPCMNCTHTRCGHHRLKPSRGSTKSGD